MSLQQDFEFLQREWSAEPLPGGWRWKYVTPRHSFFHTIHQLNSERFVIISARDDFKSHLAQHLLAFANLHLKEFNERPLRKLSGFYCPGEPFSHAAIVAPTAHDTITSDMPCLKQLVHLIFPVYQCEFLEDEDDGLVRLLRRDYVSTLDWNRKPQPTLRMKFINATTGVRSTGKKFGFARLDECLSIVTGLDPNPSSRVEVLNYARNYLRLTRNCDDYELIASFDEFVDDSIVISNSQAVHIKPESIEEAIKCFTISGALPSRQ